MSTAYPVSYEKRNILEALKEMVAAQPDRTVVVSGDGAVRLSYAEVDERSNRLANALLCMGIRKRDRVALFQVNRWQYVEQYWALLKIGAICVPMNYRLRGPQAAFILNESGARVLFLEERYVEMFEEARPYLLAVENYVCVSGRAPEWATDYETLLSGSSPEPPPAVELSLDDVCAICFTSGTTGLPKGSTSTHRNVMVNFYDNFGRMLREQATDPELGCAVNLLNVPIYHIAGILFVYMASSMGDILVIPEAFTPESFMQIVARERVTTTYLVPTMFKMILDHPAFGQYDLESLRFISYGAMPMHPELLRQILASFPGHVRYLDAFGCTELNATCIAKLPEDHDLTGPPEEVEKKIERLKGVGRPLNEGIEVAIRTEEGREAEPGEVGEIVCRGDKVTPGYWRNPEANEKAFRDGWFHTGDMAWKDTDGYFYFADRKKDMINRGGENIFPAEVEGVLIQHPAVAEAAVFGVPDMKWGARVCAAVVAQAGESPSEEDLVQFCKDRVASYKAPASIYFLEALPRTFEGGKVKRRTLREKYSQQ